MSCGPRDAGGVVGIMSKMRATRASRIHRRPGRHSAERAVPHTRTSRAVLLALVMAALAFAPTRAESQQDVHGTVIDSAGAPVKGAMLVGLALPDSILTKFGLSRGDGTFVLSRVPAGDYTLQVTMVGYRTLHRDFRVADGDVDVGSVRLELQAVQMDSLVVSVEHVPFVNRGDTLDYNVLAFPVPPNAAVEDLLKRLPGIDVAADGSIKALGVDVRNVLVDGKEFFGSDPKIATRTLPADAVKRVQVYDKQSDQAEFTGVPDGNEQRTIDLELKEEAKTGHFGSVTSSLGGDGAARLALASPSKNGMRYDEALNLNRFSPSTQLAVTGSINNVNQAGFSWVSAPGGSGFGSALGGTRDDGLTTFRSAGLNGSHDFGKERWLRASYFLSSLNNVQDRTVQQQQLLGSSVGSLADGTNHDGNENVRHSLNVNAQYAVSEGNEIRLRANLGRSSASASHTGYQETRTVDGALINTAATDRTSESKNLSGGAALTWRKRLGNEGRTLVAEISGNLNDPNQSTDLTSTTGAVAGDSTGGAGSGDLSYDQIVQKQSQGGRTLSQSERISLTQRLGTAGALEVFGQRRAVDERNNKEAWDLGGSAPVLNQELSARFNRTYTYLQGGARLSRNKDKTLMTLGLQVQRSSLAGDIVDRGEHIENGYTHVLPDVRFRYQPKAGRSLDLRYSTSTREPSITQLQPSADNSDPLRVYVGNPDLQPEYSQNVGANYRSFDQFSFTNLYGSARVSWTRDDIVQARSVDARGVQTITPVNLAGSWSAGLSAGYGRPVRRFGAKVDLGYSLSYSKSTELLNDARNESRRLSHTASIRLENRTKDVVDLSAGANLSWSDVRYSLNESLDRSYLNSTFSTRATWYYHTAWTLTSTFDYRLYDKDVFGPGRDVGLLNATVSRYVADKRGELRITGFDLLAQNQGVTFSNSASGITESRVQSLGRHVMVSFLWRLGVRPGRR